MKKSYLLSILNILLAITTIVVNILANALPLNGKSTGILSDQYPNLFVPAGLTFSIWGLIYILFLVFVVFHLIVVFTNPRAAEKYTPIHIGFAISCVLNMSWIFAWHYEQVTLSVLIMLLLFITLAFLFTFQHKLTAHNQLSIASVLPIDVYFGWISVATIANITAWLVHIGWNSWGVAPDIWTMLLISIGGLIAVTILICYQALAYAAVIVWAYLGIIIKRSSSEPVYQNIIMTAWIAIIIVVLVMIQTIFILLTKKKKLKASPTENI